MNTGAGDFCKMEDPVELQEYLDILPFPAFVVDCNYYTPNSGMDPPGADSIRIVLVNKATRDGHMGKAVAREINDNPAFRKWLSLTHPDGTSVSGQEFFETQNLEFSFNFLRSRSYENMVDIERYKVVNSRPRANIRGERPASRRTASWTKAWSRHTPQTNVSLHRDHLEFLLAKDWENTPLGPLEDWPQSLRTMSSYVMNCPFPCAMYWGEDLAVF